ncbi:AhpC/TSA family protein [Nocardia otitidiscaviarum]|uniref:thioredoxin-dependent peroxiredoxin n=1 Tax=Nocardia otitidiscaviarum TaxID=1823 RepID=A0A516NV06_9NOCA|nr:peroxiredoxin-like family protein [Nocardia otitidiscaviarum]MCP9622182.1 AhpC/TSA family protein [Nocardia otitidiscaviarum]QDP82752.1 AhpC/TSA family protein [Nocardia otitidiscaviarum]
MGNTYAEQVIRMYEQMRGTVPEELVARLHRNAEKLSPLGDKALQVGDRAPDFTLPGATGAEFTLSAALRSGPVVLTFYRGNWCPYCNLELRVLQSRIDDFRALGARLVAISPQSPDDSLSMTEKHELDFDVLSDGGNRIAADYGLLFTVDEAIRADYLTVGADLSAGDWELPVPATYVIGSDGTIVYAFTDGDYRQRAEPEDILTALRQHFSQ